MDDSSLWRAVHRIEDAERKIGHHAQQAEDAAQRIAHLLEDGYGGNGLKLIELLLDGPITIVNNVATNNLGEWRGGVR